MERSGIREVGSPDFIRATSSRLYRTLVPALAYSAVGGGGSQTGVKNGTCFLHCYLDIGKESADARAGEPALRLIYRSVQGEEVLGRGKK